WRWFRFFFFSSRRRHTRSYGDWSSDVCSSDLGVRNLLVVEDDEIQRSTIAELIGTGDDVEITAVGTADEAFAALEEKPFDCMVRSEERRVGKECRERGVRCE